MEILWQTSAVRLAVMSHISLCISRIVTKGHEKACFTVNDFPHVQVERG